MRITKDRINKKCIKSSEIKSTEKRDKIIISRCLPFLKWPGGKRLLIKYILPVLPVVYRSYYEPFVGGGALFFYLKPKNAIVSDSNVELINCYRQVRDYPEKVICYLNQLRNSEEEYYRVRDEVPSSQIAKAARLIYLTTLSFNGIYRLNKNGVFNVPYGKKTHINPCNESRILVASETLRSAQLRTMDFEESVKDAKEGDLIYFDPPYTVAHGNNGFIKYNAKIFSWEDQTRLAKIAKDLADRGCKVIISNAFHSSVQELYKDFNYRIIKRSSVIAATGINRRLVSECIYYNEV